MRKLLLFSLIILFVVTGCSKNEEDFTVGYVSKCEYEKSNDEWTYFFCIQFPKINQKSEQTKGNYEFNNKTNYIFDAYSFNREYTRNSYIALWDEKGEEIDRFPVNTASFSTHIDYRKEIEIISEFFTKKKFSNLISESDLSDLNINKISKNTIVRLFNAAFSKEENQFGKYYEMPFSDSKTELISNEKNVVVYYYIDYGNIIDLYIDIEPTKPDEDSLKEKVKISNADPDEIEIYNGIIDIENKVIELGKFDIENELKKLNGEVYEKISRILKDLENYGKEEN